MQQIYNKVIDLLIDEKITLEQALNEFNNLGIPVSEKYINRGLNRSEENK